jgi:hypothetical protein
MINKCNFFVLLAISLIVSCNKKQPTPTQVVEQLCTAVQNKNTTQINTLLLHPDSLFTSMLVAENKYASAAFFFNQNYKVGQATFIADTAFVPMQPQNASVQYYELQLVKNAQGAWRILLPWFLNAKNTINQPNGAADARSIEEVELSNEQIKREMDSLKKQIKKEMNFKTDQEVEEYLQQVN